MIWLLNPDAIVIGGGVAKAGRLIGYVPSWSLDKGYPRYIAWYKKFFERSQALARPLVEG